VKGTAEKTSFQTTVENSKGGRADLVWHITREKYIPNRKYTLNNGYYLSRSSKWKLLPSQMSTELQQEILLCFMVDVWPLRG